VEQGWVHPGFHAIPANTDWKIAFQNNAVFMGIFYSI